MHIIPVIYVRQGKIVSPVDNPHISFTSDPFELAKYMAGQGAHIVHVLDLDSTQPSRSATIDIMGRMIDELGLLVHAEINPQEPAMADAYAAIGCARIIIGSEAYKNPNLFPSLCQRYPGRIGARVTEKDGKVEIKGWIVASRKNIFDYGERFKAAGAGVILFSSLEGSDYLNDTSIERLTMFCQKTPLTVINATDPDSIDSLRKLMTLPLPSLSGIMLAKAFYAGHIQLDEAVSFVETFDDGMDEPTLQV
jgi:phosphoribosylformimino-5-aminoimidazole carboxamide ribotide isomerase